MTDPSTDEVLNALRQLGPITCKALALSLKADPSHLRDPLLMLAAEKQIVFSPQTDLWRYIGPASPAPKAPRKRGDAPVRAAVLALFEEGEALSRDMIIQRADHDGINTSSVSTILHRLKTEGHLEHDRNTGLFALPGNLPDRTGIDGLERKIATLWAFEPIAAPHLAADLRGIVADLERLA